MPLSSTLGVEAERLARVGRKADLSCSDKNGQRPRDVISSTGATPLGSPSGWKGLVAGNVTGGGGKATKKRPNGTGRESVAKRVINLGADRGMLSAERASGYKSGGSNVYMREPPNL